MFHKSTKSVSKRDVTKGLELDLYINSPIYEDIQSPQGVITSPENKKKGRITMLPASMLSSFKISSHTEKKKMRLPIRRGSSRQQ